MDEVVEDSFNYEVVEDSFDNEVVEDSLEGEVDGHPYEEARERNNDKDEVKGTKITLPFDLNESGTLDFDLNERPDELGEDFEPKGCEDPVREMLRINLPKFF
ncbi:OLC1v1028559C1 [Oldenlandia corymbosa var. corymbosa]|uniref:OLC1v1028559C1 n=1 Tax=Oldenlandia corymbosa var. corymbosa TaxID=529605 RepID=A0AAV1CD57_OLDCO|nr:OLC1v1028559C1 [Oldenlandia corymbosa var. corymbosa]